MLLLVITSNAQLSNNATVNNSDGQTFVVKIWKNDVFVPGYINNVKASVIRSFNKMFDNPQQVNWFVDDKDVTAYFIYNNESVAVHYHGKGYYISARRVYDATMLDPRIYSYIRQEIGKRYIVNLVTEVVTEKGITYEISLEDKKNWLFLQVERNNERNIFTTTDTRLYKKG